MLCYGAGRMAWLLSKMVWRFLSESDADSPHDPASPFLARCSKELKAETRANGRPPLFTAASLGEPSVTDRRAETKRGVCAQRSRSCSAWTRQAAPTHAATWTRRHHARGNGPRTKGRTPCEAAHTRRRRSRPPGRSSAEVPEAGGRGDGRVEFKRQRQCCGWKKRCGET